MTRMSKMVTFRLSPEEFELFKDRCAAMNVRSISEMARDAVHRYLDNLSTSSDEDLGTKVLTLESKIETLESEVAHLSRRVSLLSRNGVEHES